MIVIFYYFFLSASTRVSLIIHLFHASPPFNTRNFPENSSSSSHQFETVFIGFNWGGPQQSPSTKQFFRLCMPSGSDQRYRSAGDRSEQRWNCSLRQGGGLWEGCWFFSYPIFSPPFSLRWPALTRPYSRNGVLLNLCIWG